MKRGKKESIYVPTRAGELKQRSCGTGRPEIVKGMKRMVVDCRDEPRWLPVLDAIEARTLTLREAYRYYARKEMPALVGRLTAIDLASYLEGWKQWLIANRQEGVRTPEVYWQQVTSLVVPGKPFPAADLTKGRVIQWLTSRAKASSGTRRKYLYALRSFINYLLDMNALTVDPLAGIKAPKKNRARDRWVTADVDETIVANALPRYQAFFAFIHGTGCDVGSAERARKGDVNLFAGRADIRGTKTDRRAVHQAVIEPWALAYVRAHLRTMQDADRDALLFPGLPRRSFQQYHGKLTARLGVTDYTLKDARHSVAVRMRKAGKTFEQIAQQLGTSVFQAVTVYSKFQPDADVAPALEEAQR